MAPADRAAAPRRPPFGFAARISMSWSRNTIGGPGALPETHQCSGWLKLFDEPEQLVAALQQLDERLSRTPGASSHGGSGRAWRGCVATAPVQARCCCVFDRRAPRQDAGRLSSVDRRPTRIAEPRGVYLDNLSGAGAAFLPRVVRISTAICLSPF
jgi:hypothetical protein